MLNPKDMSFLPAVTARREIKDTVANSCNLHKNRNERPEIEIFCSYSIQYT